MKKEIEMYQIELPIVTQYIYLFFGNGDNFNEFIISETGNDISDTISNSYGLNICIDNSIYVYIDKRSNKKTMAHELIHATWATIKNRGFELEEELFAHIYCWLWEYADECRMKKREMGTLEYEKKEYIMVEEYKNK